MAGNAASFAFGTPWADQIAFLRRKLDLPSERWDSIVKSAHDRAFIVAGAMQADLVADLHKAVLRAAESGAGLEAFRRDFNQVVAKHGWVGWTGSDSPGGVAWRTKVIYQTNMATSYAAGRYKQLTDPDMLQAMPYWRYIHDDGVLHPRPQHLAWHGVTLRHDHSFWQAHFPPNGWGCHCRITAVSAAEGKRSAAAGLGDPPGGWDTVDPKTGAVAGIDRGFDYTPGAGVDASLRSMVQEKLIQYPPAIARALSAEVRRYVNATESVVKFVSGVLENRTRNDPLWLGFVENPAPLTELLGIDVTGYMVLIPADAPRHVETHHEWDGKGQRPPTPEDYTHLLSVLNEPDSAKRSESNDGKLVSLVATKAIGTDTFRAVFDVRSGKKNMALTLKSLSIKTGSATR